MVFCVSGISQNSEEITNEVKCLTPTSSSNLNELPNVRLQDHSLSTFHLRVKVHVLRLPGDPTSGQRLLAVNEAMNILYEAFDPMDVYLVWDGFVDYIDDTDLYSGSDPDAIFNTNDQSNRIDIYLLDNRVPGYGKANGIGESTEFVIGGYTLNENEDDNFYFINSEVLPHELGHVFFLFHTFHGSPAEAGDCAECDDPNDPFNRSSCGDYINDTPPDYGFNWTGVDENCNYTQGGQDDCGFPLNPLTDNFMSYSDPKCRTSFTNAQKKRMKNAIGHFPHLQNTHLTNFDYIRGDSSLICDFISKEYFVYSDSFSDLTIESSSNVTIDVQPIVNGRRRVIVTNDIIGQTEGEMGYIRLKRNGQVLTQREFWVGLPQAVPASGITGPLSVFPGDTPTYSISQRLGGAQSYVWDYPGQEGIDNFENYPFEPPFTLWQYGYFGKIDKFTDVQVGVCSGELSLYGMNECGNGLGDDVFINANQNNNCDPPPGPEIVYYPNPADDLLEIDLSLQAYSIFTIKILDGNQNVVHESLSENVVKTIDTFNLTNGIYYLHIYDGNNLILNKILVINH